MARARKRKRRRGYVRPSRAKPKTGWTLRQLGQLVGLAPRSLRLYLESGVLPRPAFKGSATRYQRSHLLRLIAARKMMAAERLTLAQANARLNKLGQANLESVATSNLNAGPLATALGVEPAPAASPGAGEKKGTGVSDTVPRWARIEVALGLELHVREDASQQVIDLSRKMCEMARGGG